MRAWLFLNLFLGLSLFGCAAKKNADLKTLDASTGGASENSALSPRSVSHLQELFTVYGSEHGLDRDETLALLKRFRPELLPLIDAALPAGKDRYSSSQLMSTLQDAFPPLKWTETQDISDATGLRLALKKEFPEIPEAALADYLARVAPQGHTEPALLLRSGLAANAFAKPAVGPAEYIRHLALGKVSALYGQAEGPWAAVLLGARTLANGSAAAGDDKKARAFHRILFQGAPRATAQANDLEAQDALLDSDLAAQVEVLAPAAKLLPLALARSQNGDSSLRDPILSERLYAWELLTLTDFVLQQCQVPAGDSLDQEDLAVALYRIKTESKGEADGFCPAARDAYAANLGSRLLWRVRAGLGNR